MKKILYSILIAGSVGGLAFGATQAFFSDRETSEDNTFVAGKVDLTIDSTAHYDGMICQGGVWIDEDADIDPNHLNNPRPELVGQPCTGTWNFTDLTQKRFFDLSDIKPGDYGENTISLHVEDNPVWACIDISGMHNYENGCTEPEGSSEGTDATCDTPGDGQGELAQNLRFTAWLDNAGDGCNNIWEAGETLLFSNTEGPASDVLNGKTYTLADSALQPIPFPAGATNCIGLAWCAGTMIVDRDLNTIACNGAGMGNDTQTDSLTADVTFRVEQSRNNPGFRCEPTPTP